MTDLENRLRESFARQVTAPPPVLDLPDAVVRRGRRARHRRAGASVVAAIAVLAGGLVLAQQSGPARQSLQPGGPGADPLQGYAVGTGDDIRVAVGVDSRATFPAERGAGPGFDGRVVASALVPFDAPVPGPVAAVVDPGTGVLRLEVLGTDHVVRRLADDVAPGLAVDVEGKRVAYATASDLVVLSISTGKELARHQLVGVPGGWVGDEVLVTSGGEVKAWDTRKDTVRVVAEPSAYTAVLGAGAHSDLVALTRGGDGCVTVSHLADRPDLWSDCDHEFVGFSPLSGSVLLRDDQGWYVRDARTGDLLGSPHLPRSGVLAAGLATDDAVLALVRYRLRTGESTVSVISCPAAGDSPCVLAYDLGDAEHGWVAGSRP